MAGKGEGEGVCVVTGGAGFIGCAISTALSRRFARVIAIDSLHPQIHAARVRPSALANGVELMVADVTAPETWDELLAMARPDVVVHLAAETGTGQSLTEASRHADVNVLGTTRMLDAFARIEAAPKRIVLSSSRAVYGEGAWREQASGAIVYPGQRSAAMLGAGVWDFPGLECLPFDAASTEARPTSVYGATKLAQEHILSAWCLAFGTELAMLRLQNVYGRGQSLKNAYTGIVSLFAQLARAGEAIPVYEDGEIVRDFVHIEDVAVALAAVTGAGAPPGVPYDIGSGVATTITELAGLVARRYGAPSPVVTGRYRNGDVRYASCTIERARAALGWEPRWTLQAGLDDLCAWIDYQAA